MSPARTVSHASAVGGHSSMTRSDSQARGAVLAASPPATDNPTFSKASHEFAGMPHDSGLRPPQNPILFVHRRGRDVEVCHRGAVAIQRGEDLILTAGDVSRPYFVRSAAKPFQTLPLLIDDGVQRFSLSQEEVAVTSSSHGGEPFHVSAVRSLLEKGGFAPAQLLCGVHAPLHEPSAHALVRANEPPKVLHNNCSGKHAGMLLQSKIQGASPDRYIDRDHPVQRRIHALVA